MSDISFNAIPPDVRVPLAYIEFDNSNAVSGTPAPRQRVLMFGQSNKGASAAPDVPVRIRSGSQASAAFGQGSMLALMADAFLKANRVAELWCIPQAKNPGNTISKTTVGLITLSGTATENGSLVTYIAGQRLAVSVAAGTKGSKLAGLLTDRINGHPDLPVKAVLLSTTPDDAGATDIVLTAKFTGALSAVDVRWNYYAGETTPYGIITAFKAESRKYINPDISASIAGMGDLQYKYIVMPYTDEPNLNLLRTELQERWGPVSQADGFAVTVLSGTYGDISTFGVRRNDHLISCTRTAFSTWNRLAQRFERRHAATAGRQGAITTSYNSPVAEKNIATLNYVMLAAAQTYRAEAASQALTAALDFSRRMDNAARAPVLDAPSTTTGTASGASSTSATVTQGQLQLTAITPDGGFSQVSFSDSGTATPPVFESVSDIGKTAAMLGAALDTVILTASEQGFSTDSVQLTQLRLLVVADLEKRGLQLAGSETHRLPETMPAMVALYRYTGNSRNWQRLARRNGISNPLFVPGGVSIEVINE
ncbi:TPA: phage tail sheath subtilisin-like domain-containing protein [Escherichia coli]